MSDTPAAFDPDHEKWNWIKADVSMLAREPFRRRLARLLSVEESPEALQTFANKSPDRYWQAVTQAAKLAGYSEKIEVHHGGMIGFAQKLEAMSDADIMALQEKLKALPAPSDEPSEEAPE